MDIWEASIHPLINCIKRRVEFEERDVLMYIRYLSTERKLEDEHMKSKAF